MRVPCRPRFFFFFFVYLRNSLRELFIFNAFTGNVIWRVGFRAARDENIIAAREEFASRMRRPIVMLEMKFSSAREIPRPGGEGVRMKESTFWPFGRIYNMVFRMAGACFGILCSYVFKYLLGSGNIL